MPGMSANESLVTTPVKAVEPKTAKEWLDALCAGACDQDSFLRAVTELSRKTPDACWEVLSLLDQYYRRGKIAFELFQKLESHLQTVAVSAETKSSSEFSVPLPMTQPGARDKTARIGPVRPRPLVAPAAAPATSPPSPAIAPAAISALDATSAAPAAPAPRVAPLAAAIPAPVAASPTVAIPLSAAVAGPTAAALPPVRESRSSGSRAQPAVGDLLRGRYRLERILGKGGTGTVFEAIDNYRTDPNDPNQRLALKVLYPAVAAQPELFAELRAEFEHLQGLAHPNIVRVHGFDRDGDTAFFTMELLNGYLLSKVLELKHDVPLNRAHAFGIIRGVGDALAHAHARGVVHGDVSPQNIFITNPGEVRVLDFGAAHVAGPGPWISAFEAQPQTPVATPRFASCQVLEGQRADVRDDLYALACVAYVLLAGSHPFKDHTAVEARTLHLKPRRPPGLTGSQWHALRSGLSIERERRPAGLEEWLRRLDPRRNTRRLPPLSVIMGPTTRSPRLFRTDFAMTGAVVIVLAAVWWATADDNSPANVIGRLSRAATAALQTAAGYLSGFPAAPSADSSDSASSSGSPSAPSPAVAASPRAEQPRVSTAPTVVAPAPQAAPAPLPTPPAAAPPVVAATSAPSHVAPNPLARIELAADTTEVQAGEPVAQVIVRRKGFLRSDATFTWWTESGTAKAGMDFAGAGAHVEHIDAGKDHVTLSIPVIVNPRRRQPANFYVVIDQPGPGASLGARTLGMVSILPPE
jgi:serine/threonine protein kinase